MAQNDLDFHSCFALSDFEQKKHLIDLKNDLSPFFLRDPNWCFGRRVFFCLGDVLGRIWWELLVV
jgi:hypothetical protein